MNLRQKLFYIPFQEVQNFLTKISYFPMTCHTEPPPPPKTPWTMNDNELVVEREMFSLYGQKYLLYGP